MSTPHQLHNQYRLLGIGILLGLLVLGISYIILAQYLHINTLTDAHDNLAVKLASTTDAFHATQMTSTRLATELSQTQISLDTIKKKLVDEQNQNQDFEDQITQISGTVGALDKVAKTDPELLKKYSKVYFLNENYIPAGIKQIDPKYVLAGKGDQYFAGDALPFLTKMIDAAIRAHINLKVDSAYRSFETQSDLKSIYTQTYASGANAFSADQGYSEHQLGTAVDLTTPTIAGAYVTFKATDAYTWLQENAYRYGFELSYPEDNDYYVFEPWHWRFVGVKLTTDLHRAGVHFYDWDQRKIDGYLVSLFD